MAHKALGIINSAPNYIRVEGLHDYRPIGAFSFLGRFRVIDFPISNMSNSGLDRIHVYLNSRPRSIVEHIGSGRHYNINSKRGSLQMMFTQNNGASSIYNTDINSYMENIEQIERADLNYVVIAPSYMVYKQDFQTLLEFHVETGTDITVMYHKVDQAKDYYRGCNILNLNKQKGVASIERNMGTAKEKNISMDTYVMTKEVFLYLVKRARNESSAYSFADMINLACNDMDVRGYLHKGYFAAITSLDDYYRANMELLDYNIASDLFRPGWQIYTKTTDACPSKYYSGASVKNSMICNGCLIEGTVENSIIGRNVHIGRDAVIKDSIILSYSDIADGTRIERAVVDKWAEIKKLKNISSNGVTPAYVKRSDIL